MPIAPGRYTLGPQHGQLLVHTKRSGAAAKAGHDLELEVTDWSGTVEVGEETSLTLTADSRSLRVRQGTGGMQALDEGDKDNIRQTIDDEVLKGTPIEFRSRSVETSADGNHLRVEGDLELAGTTAPVSFELTVAQQGRVMGTATVRQTEWGMKPYSALFGALKVADEVGVTVDAALES